VEEQMMGKIAQSIAVATMTVGLGVASAGEAPAALGSADYQPMSSQQMERVAGKIQIPIGENTGDSFITETRCRVLCAGGEVNVPPGSLPELKSQLLELL
jgi:hypothetical protein